jgi:hypothetical protein
MAYKNREQQLEYMRKWQQEHPKWYAAKLIGLIAVGSGDRGIKAIRAEVAKCELLCKPCHLERHKTMKKTP